MPPLRFLALPCLFGIALLLAACGKKNEPTKVAPKPAEAPTPAPTRVRSENPPAPETGGKKHPTLEGLAAARIDGNYVRLLYKNGQKGLFPATDLSVAETEWLTDFIVDHPLAPGKSTVVVAKEVIEAKKTIEKQSIEEGIETVQLIAPAKLRDQIGSTCMFYARVHYLDIAGYPVDDGEIYRGINSFSTDKPFEDYRYHIGMQLLFLKQKPTPVAHCPDGTLTPFEWARQQLRKGRPILAALPENIWLSLPADYLATHPFEGNSKIGHQVVINGFTYNASTRKATFHIVNSWRVLSEFNVTVEPRDEKNILMEQSLSPKGAPPEVAEKVVAGAVTLIKPVGKQNLYSIETNTGPKRVMAVSEDGAREFVEMDTSAKDSETAYGEYVTRVYDYIYRYADPSIRDIAAAKLLAEIFKISPNVALPRVDLEVNGALGTTYFVRVTPEKVVKLYADTSDEALAKAKQMTGSR